ncbi:SANT/Myb_domain [Hexamita inflata]|uniref:SANT/Myb_domain n=1 Tax=Hexamita inflata TaxID=28002 RepID=A0ABP1HZX8_9EUKA
MSSNLNEKHLISAIQRLLDLTISDPSSTIYQVLILPDAVYNQLFCQLSFDMNLKIEAIHLLFISMSTKYLYIVRPHSNELYELKQSINNQTQSLQSQNMNDKVKKQQNDKVPLSEFKIQFLETVQKIMREFESSVDQMTNKQLSQSLIQYFQAHGQNHFWEQVQNVINYKTKLQLKEYFQKSFQQCQYEKISDIDKNRIKELVRIMPQSKPSEIADAFFNQIGNQQYFRRKVIMFIQYQKKVE